jgi:replicative DNA helicase
LLGSVLIDAAILPVVAEIAQPEDCDREAHRAIFRTMCDLSASATPPELVTVCDELARRGKLDEVGGTSYISGLANQAPTSLNAEHYAHIVASKRILRNLIEAAGKIAAIAYNEPDAEVALHAVEHGDAA